jgi:VIT1/CCC1 family predicted Fe2+/Mn2+ transporter
VREASDPQHGQLLLAAALPPVVASVMAPGELEAVRERLQRLGEPPARARLSRSDWLGAVGVFLLVFVTTFPVAIPFLVMTSAPAALRVSNAIAITMLFAAGYAFGRIVGGRPWAVGGAMVLLGASLVALTIRLGG